MLPLFVVAIGLSQAVSGEGTIAGRITDAITHQPVAGVKVTYCCTPVIAETDASGSFLLHVEPAFPESRFTLAKEGYVTLRKTVPGGPRDRDFEMTPSARLNGRLVDGDSGEPLAGFMVVAIYQGSPLALHLSTPSGKDGSFAMSGEMTPGNYIVQARPPKEYKFTAGRVTGAEVAHRGYASTFYPGVPSADGAAPVAVSPGENRHIEIRLREIERFYIAGTIEVPRGRETDTLNMTVIRNGGMVGSSQETFKPGPFHIDGLAPGSYNLCFTTRTGAALNQPVELTSRNIDDLTITLRTAVALRATVTILEDKATPPEHISFRALPSYRNDLQADPSDSLYVQGLPPGQYWPVLSLAPGYAVTAVTYAGRPVYNTPILIEAEESTVSFVVTSRTAAVTGIVRDSNQIPVPHVTVVLSPYPAPGGIDPFNERRYRTSSGANGAFRIADLTPGSYTVVAGNGDGRKIDLDFAQTVNVDLQVK